MKAFLDTNILIDVLSRRIPFYEAASNVINLGITGQIELCATSMSFGTTAFITKSVLGYDNAIAALQMLDPYIGIVTMDAGQCHNALFAKMPDFEDMLQFNAAVAAKADVIITRNKKHFPKHQMPILTPNEFLLQL